MEVGVEDGERMEVGSPVGSCCFNSGELREGPGGEMVCDVVQRKIDRNYMTNMMEICLVVY